MEDEPIYMQGIKNNYEDYEEYYENEDSLSRQIREIKERYGIEKLPDEEKHMVKSRSTYPSQFSLVDAVKVATKEVIEEHSFKNRALRFIENSCGNIHEYIHYKLEECFFPLKIIYYGWLSVIIPAIV